MICVSIGRTRHKMVAAEHRHLAERGAKLVEVRLDWLQRKPDLGRLLSDRPTPVVVTARRADDHGRWKWTEEMRLAVLREAIASGAEYVDLEVDIAGLIPRYGDTQRIVSYHNFEETPLHLPEIYEELRGSDPDIIKLATLAKSPSDNVRMLELISRSDVPMVAFCMGEMGVISRILCGRYGAPFTYASFSSERVLAPGQIAFKDMRHMYRFNRLTEHTEVFGVLGDPIGHSLSPLVHNVAFQANGIDAVYLPMQVPVELFDDTLEAFHWLGVRGYSVTMPHKETALIKGEICDDRGTEIGAANTLFFKNEQWHTTNTDYGAALDAIEELLKSDDLGELADRHALLLGAGGVARAIGLAIARSGATLTVANRTHDRAIALADELNCQQTTWENRGSVHAGIVVNCTPVGMHPNVDETPYEGHWFRDNAIAFDTIYNPENTLFLKEARERGFPTVSGLEMFVRQAALQFEIFTGQDPPLEKMREAVRYGISPTRR